MTVSIILIVLFFVLLVVNAIGKLPAWPWGLVLGLIEILRIWGK